MCLLQIYDLLNMTGESLAIRQSSGLGFFVTGQVGVAAGSGAATMTACTDHTRA